MYRPDIFATSDFYPTVFSLVHIYLIAVKKTLRRSFYLQNLEYSCILWVAHWEMCPLPSCVMFHFSFPTFVWFPALFLCSPVPRMLSNPWVCVFIVCVLPDGEFVLCFSPDIHLSRSPCLPVSPCGVFLVCLLVWTLLSVELCLTFV